MAEIELSEHIRNKVREALMISLSDEQLNEFIKVEMDSFFKEKTNSYDYVPTPFRLMVKREIQEKVKEAVKKWMDENFHTEWDGNAQVLVGQAVKEFVPVVLESFGTALVSSALSEIRQRLQLQ